MLRNQSFNEFGTQTQQQKNGEGYESEDMAVVLFRAFLAGLLGGCGRLLAVIEER